MSTKLINELTSLNVTPDVDDLLVIKDTSVDLTKKITVGDLMSYPVVAVSTVQQSSR